MTNIFSGDTGKVMAHKNVILLFHYCLGGIYWYHPKV